MEVSLSKPRHCNRLCSAPTLCLWDNKVKPNKSIFDTKERIIFNFKFEISVEKIWSDRRTKCISFQISFQNQTNYWISTSEAAEQSYVSQSMHDLCKLSLMFNLLFKSRKFVSNQGVKSLFSSSSSPQLPTQDSTYFINESCPPTWNSY